jgi:hypothetical protein
MVRIMWTVSEFESGFENYVREQLMKKRMWFCTLAGVALVFVAAARADLGTITASYNGEMPGTLWARLGGDGMARMGGYYIGLSQFTNSLTGEGFYGFCIDLTQEIAPGTYTWTEGALTDAPVGKNGATPYTIQQWQADRIGELWQEHYAQDVWLGGSTFSAQNAAAFQAAVWEIIYQAPSGPDRAAPVDPSTYDVTAGWDQIGDVGFQVTTPSGGGWTGAIAGTANSWLRSLQGDPAAVALDAITSYAAQDFVIIGTKSSGNILVSAPAAIVIAGLGLGLVGWAKRRLT